MTPGQHGMWLSYYFRDIAMPKILLVLNSGCLYRTEINATQVLSHAKSFFSSKNAFMIIQALHKAVNHDITFYDLISCVESLFACTAECFKL